MNIEDLKKQNPQYDFMDLSTKKTFLYFICDEDLEIIYIGLTSMPYQRISVQYSRPEFFGMPVIYFEIPREIDAITLERQFISDIKPKYKIQKWRTMEMIPKKPYRKKKHEKKIIINPRKVKALMKKNKITQALIAEKLKTTRQNVSLHINSGHIPISMHKAIIEALGYIEKELLV